MKQDMNWVRLVKKLEQYSREARQRENGHIIAETLDIIIEAIENSIDDYWLEHQRYEDDQE